jgi:hypothetical protein
MQHPVGYRIVRRKALIDQLEARREELLRRLGHGS